MNATSLLGGAAGLIGVGWLAAMGFMELKQTLDNIETTTKSVLERLDALSAAAAPQAPTVHSSESSRRLVPAAAGQPEPEAVEGYGVVSEYSAGITKCGIPFDEHDVFAAHHNLPCGTLLYVSNTLNGDDEPLEMRVLERAGSPSTWSEIVLSLSQGAADELGIQGRAVISYVVSNIP